MRQKYATAPWNSLSSGTTKRGRPRTIAPKTNGSPGCIWPNREGAACRGQVELGLALCGQHAKILTRGPGWSCAWPGCPQPAPFHGICTYHLKLAQGLMDAAR